MTVFAHCRICAREFPLPISGRDLCLSCLVHERERTAVGPPNMSRMSSSMGDGSPGGDRRRGPDRRERADRRTGPGDRRMITMLVDADLRMGGGDRRMGLPDRRVVMIERRAV